MTNSRRDRAARALIFAVLAVGLFTFLFPIIWMAGTSLKTPAETAQPMQVFPRTPQWTNFRDALWLDEAGVQRMDFPNALANTVVVTVLCVFGQVLSCSLVGFGFARFRFPGRNALFLLLLATMMLPAQVTMIPVFVIFRQLGLVDSLGALIIPSWLGGAFFVYLFRQFFASIPEEVLEAARVDGASDWRIFWRIMLPMSWPVVAVVAVYTFIWTWNDYMGPLVYLNSTVKFTLAQALAGFATRYGSTEVQLLMAASLVTMLPCIVLFLAAQRYFVESEFSAAVKG